MRNSVTAFYDDWYSRNESAQDFPNEEFCRFLSRCIPVSTNKADIKILETGCGQGANLLYLKSAGYDAYGIDASTLSLEKLKSLFSARSVPLPKVFCGDMTKTGFEAHMFDIVFDIFSSFCLNESKYDEYLEEVKRIAKNDALFFSYTPSKESGAFKYYHPAQLIDGSTLNGIFRTDSPFYGNNYPFRFMSKNEATSILEKHSFHVEYLESVSRTYNEGKETFIFLLIQAQIKKQ